MEPDPYAILRCSRGASQAELKAAWHARLRENHPDRFGAAPAPVRAAAENLTGLINQAYHTLSQGTGQQGGSRRKTTGQGQPPSAQELVRQADVLTDYAAELIERWARELSGIRGRRQGIEQAGKTVEHAEEAMSHGGGIDQSLMPPLRAAIRRCFTVPLIDPLQRIQERAELIAQRAEGMRPGSSGGQGLAQASVEAERCLLELNALLDSRPTRIADARSEAAQCVQTMLAQYERQLGQVERMSTAALTAAKRARALNRTAQEDGRRVPELIDRARDAVDRAQGLAGTALGLAKAERMAERGSEGIWRSERLVTQGEALIARLMTLDAEQQRADAVLGILAGKLAEISEMTTGIRALSGTVQHMAASLRTEYDARRVDCDGLVGITAAEMGAEMDRIASYIRDSARHVSRIVQGTQ